MAGNGKHNLHPCPVPICGRGYRLSRLENHVRTKHKEYYEENYGIDHGVYHGLTIGLTIWRLFPTIYNMRLWEKLRNAKSVRARWERENWRSISRMRPNCSYQAMPKRGLTTELTMATKPETDCIKLIDTA